MNIIKYKQQHNIQYIINNFYIFHFINFCIEISKKADRFNVESKFGRILEEQAQNIKQKQSFTQKLSENLQYDKELLRLNDRLKKLIQEKTMLQEELNMAKEQIENYKKMNVLQEQKYQNLENKSAINTEQQSNIQQEIQQNAQLIDQSMQASKYVDQSMINNHMKEIQRLEEEIEEKNKTINQFKEHLQSSKQLIDQCKNQLVQYEQQNNILKQSEKELQTQLQQQTEYLYELQKQVDVAKNNQALFQDYIKQLEYKIQDLKGKIRICIRVKPGKQNVFKFSYPDRLNLKQTLCYQQIRKDISGKQIEIQQECKMDRIFSIYDKQSDVFEEVRPLIGQLMDGYSALIFAYGQSGSGKTFTQLGNRENPGLISNCLTDLFRQLQNYQEKMTVQVSISFYEIYNEKCYDLLYDQTLNLLASSAIEAEKTSQKFQAQECRISMTKNEVKIVQTLDQINDLITISQSRRKTSATILNDTSSRSHAVFTVNLCLTNNETLEEIKSSLSFVDLAGCEQLGSKADPQRKTESIFINKSLSALGNIFISLKNGQNYVNYRDSTLTKILQPYFQGNNKVIMIACITADNDNEANYQENLNTISFCQRVNTVSLQKQDQK